MGGIKRRVVVTLNVERGRPPGAESDVLKLTSAKETEMPSLINTIKAAYCESHELFIMAF